MGRGNAGGSGLQPDDNWLINMSVWWMDIDTEVKFKAGGEQQNINTRIDPWVFMFGVGYRF